MHKLFARIFLKKIQVDVLRITATASTLQSGKRKIMTNMDINHDRVAAERTQFYERLSMLSQDATKKIFAGYSIPLSEKKKKVSLTEELCTFLMNKTVSVFNFVT